jgi:hypothetical protein
MATSLGNQVTRPQREGTKKGVPWACLKDLTIKVNHLGLTNSTQTVSQKKKKIIMMEIIIFAAHKIYS